MTLEDSVRHHRLMLMQRAAQLGNVTRACQEAGISRTLFYRWRQRLLRYGPDGLRPRPTRPTRWPRQATPALEHAVLAYALLWPTHGPARIAAQLHQPRWGRWRVSPSGVYGILKRHGLQTRWERLTRLEARALDVQGLVTERTRRRVVRPHLAAEHPGDVVCVDAFYVGKLKGVGKVWQLTACDAACSYALATLVPRVTQATATAFLRTRVVPPYQRAGHQVRAVLTDGGPEFYGRFLTACRELEIEHRRTKPRHAWTTDESVKPPAWTRGWMRCRIVSDAGDPRAEERSQGMETPSRRLVLRRLRDASHWWHPRPVACACVATGV